MSEARAVAKAQGAPESVTIPLKYPIEFGKQLIEEITVQPMTGSHQRRLTSRPDSEPMGFLIELASLLSGQPQQVIDALVGNDLGAVNTTCQVFFTATQETGSSE